MRDDMFQASKLTGFIGAELSGLDLSQSITDEVALFLRESLSAYHVIVIRQQYLSRSQQKVLTTVFGEIMQLPYVSPIPEDDDVIAVLKQAHEHNTGVFGGDWHSDFSFLENPPAGSVLNAVDIPAVGGDTIWSNQAAAYRSLPEHLCEIVDNRPAVHVGKPYGVKYAPPEETKANASMTMRRNDPAADREIFHPAVIISPEAGEKALFLNPIYTTRFDGMSEAESKPYLAEIYQHCTRPDFACRHKWQVGDIVIWNNRTTLHYATNDYDGARRLLYRTTFRRAAPQ
ncbi:MAG: TauD/TfdA family dioxygenase [Pseudomonadota bacterium]